MSWHLPWHIVFFPGMILHEFAHYLACILVGVKVHEVKFWGKDEAFVRHAVPNAWQAIIITLSPFLLCNWLALEILKTASYFLSNGSALSLIYYWFAVSLLYFCFPSDADAKNALDGFVSFYRKKAFSKGPLLSRVFWLLSFPFLFLPLVLVLGLLMLFDKLLSLRLIWIFSLLIFSINSAFFLSILSLINGILLGIAQIFI